MAGSKSEYSHPMHMNAHTEFDPGMVGRGGLACHMISGHCANGLLESAFFMFHKLS